MYKKYTQGIGIPKRLYRKIWLIMRLTTIILLITLIQVSAATKAQQVTLKKENASLKSILAEIKKQTGYMMLYPSALVNDAKPITVDLQNVPLKYAMDRILDNQKLECEIQDQSVIIREKSKAKSNLIKVDLRNIEIRGRVVDSLGLSLPGVTVRIKNAKQTTITDESGEFVLHDVNENAVISFSFIGFSTKEITAKDFKGIIQLNPSNSKLDEVQIQAYGITSKRLTVGNITTIKGKEIENIPVTNPLLALIGRTPGLFIEQNSGLAGSGMKVRIQGQNSIGNGSDPLYVIDGVPYPSQMLPTVGLTSIQTGSSSSMLNPAGAGNPMNYVDPNNIESIDILKDADATAIYGSRAANGAILITTKRGSAGQMKVNLNMQSGIGKVPKFVDLINTPQYLKMRHEAIANDGLSTGPNDFDINGTWDTTRNVNWQKELIGGTAHFSTVAGDVSGGGVNTQYLFGGSYNRQTTVFPKDYANKKANAHFNLTTTSTDKKFSLTFSGSYQYDNNNLPGTDLTPSALMLAPVAPKLYTPDGSVNWAPNAAGTTTWSNPAALLETFYQGTNRNLISSLNAKYQISRFLDFRTNFGYNYLQTSEYLATPTTSFQPEFRTILKNKSSFGESKLNNFIVEPQLNFSKPIGNGILNVLVGATINQQTGEGRTVTGTEYLNDALLYNLMSAKTITAGNTVDYKYRYNALFGRVNYNLSDKYLFDISFRRDGSSSFGANNLFHNFGAVGAGWIFSNEDFIKHNLSFLSFGKIKVSYGTTGNDQIGYYKYLSLYSPTVNNGTLYQGSPGLYTGSLPNPYLQWEETKKLMAGLDLGVFHDRLIFSGSYSRNRSSNQLLSYALPAVTGPGTITANFPATVQNTSIELAINSVNLEGGAFRWTTGLNITIPKNKLIAFPNLASSSYADMLVIGQPISIIKAFKYAGVDEETGYYQFRKADGTLTSEPDEQTDRTVLINTEPKYYAGLNNSFSYKGFQLDLLFQYVNRTGSAVNYLYNTGLPPGRKFWNQPVSVLDHWKQPGDQAVNQRYSSNFDTFTAVGDLNRSDAVYPNASFLRLRNASISYTLPKGFTNQLHMTTGRIFMEGQNLLTFSSYKGLDPETGYGLPPLRIITLGIQAQF